MKPKLLIGLLALCALFAVPLQAQVTSTTLGSFSSVPTLITASATSNVLASVAVQNGKGIAIMPIFVGSNGITSNVVFSFSKSVDGTNYSTTTVTKTNAINGTTSVKGIHIFTADELDGVRYLRLDSIANGGAANITNTAVYYSIRSD